MEAKLAYLTRVSTMNVEHPFRVASNYNGHPGKWMRLIDASVDLIDHYTIRPNECVFDIDFRDWRYTQSIAQRIVSVLEAMDCPAAIYVSGGRGVHLHVRLKQIQDLVLQDYVRCTFVTDVLAKSKLLSYYGRGRPVDAAPVRFTSLRAGHMIRAPGGRKDTHFKSLVESIGEVKAVVTSAADVVYEDWIPEFTVEVNTSGFNKDQFVRDVEPIVQLTKDAYTQLPCMKRILRFPVAKGTRNGAMKVLAVACVKDKLSLASSRAWAMRIFKNLEEKGGFSVAEFDGWYEWARQSNADWWCEDAQSIRVIDESGANTTACVKTCYFFRQTALGRLSVSGGAR